MKKYPWKVFTRKCKRKCLVDTNDAASKRSMENIANGCELLIVEAVLRTETVLLSSIPLRNDYSFSSFANVPEEFRNIAKYTEGVEYINHDNILRSGWKYRQLHTNVRPTTSVIKGDKETHRKPWPEQNVPQKRDQWGRE